MQSSELMFFIKWEGIFHSFLQTFVGEECMIRQKSLFIKFVCSCSKTIISDLPPETICPSVAFTMGQMGNSKGQEIFN